MTLPAPLIQLIKHRSIDEQLALSHFVERVLGGYLEQELPMSTDPVPPALQLQPMVHVDDVGAATRFLEQLGASIVNGSRDGDFVLLRLGGTELSLLGHPPNPEQDEGRVELNFECRGSVDELQRQLGESGVDIVQPVTDEGFGRQLQLQMPGGPLVKVNELDASSYG